MKTYPYNFDSLKPHCYIVKLGFTGVYSILPLSAQKHRFWVPTLRGGSNEYPKCMFWAEIWKISEFLSENFQFLVMKFSIYLNRCVFVMSRSASARMLEHASEAARTMWYIPCEKRPLCHKRATQAKADLTYVVRKLHKGPFCALCIIYNRTSKQSLYSENLLELRSNTVSTNSF